MLGLFRVRLLRADHFRTEDGACLLGKAGRRAFYEAVEEPLQRMRARLMRLARAVARAADRVAAAAATERGMQP